MARELQHLYLHLAQLRLEGERALSRDYHTQKVKDLIGENNRLLDFLLTTYNEATLNANIDLFYGVLWFIGNSYSYIVSSTSDDVRSEIFTCLRFVLKEWIPSPETYVIICSQGDYAYNSFYLNGDDFYDQIESYFGFKYVMKMIPIKMPFHMQGDFMFNAALYHEIGHFIDHYHNMTGSIIEDVKNGKLIIPQSDVYLKDITKDAATDAVGYYKQLTAYIKEYYADLFAARYTSKSLFQYLNYVNPKGAADDEHPSTICTKEQEPFVVLWAKATLIEAMKVPPFDIALRQIYDTIKDWKSPDLTLDIQVEWEDSLEGRYASWVNTNCLRLNRYNDINPQSKLSQEDSLYFGGLLLKKEEMGKEKELTAIFNQLKQEYVSARYMLYQYFIESGNSHFSDKDVWLMESNAYAEYSYNIEIAKAAFRALYCIFR